MLNQVLLCGRLTKDPDIEVMKSGIKMCKICVAVPKEIRNKEDGSRETNFFMVTLWQGLAELIGNSCRKGNLVIVKGRLEMNNYENMEGKKVVKMSIIGEKVLFLDPKQQTTDAIDEEILEETLE